MFLCLFLRTIFGLDRYLKFVSLYYYLASFNQQKSPVSKLNISLFLFPKWIKIVERQRDKILYRKGNVLIQLPNDALDQLRAQISKNGTLNLP